MLCECHEAVGVCGRGDLCEKAHGEAELIRLRAAKELGNTKTADGAKLADLFFLRMPPATAALQPEDLSGRSLRFDFSELPPADGYSSAEAAELRAAAASAAERCAAASALLSERLCGLAAAAMERVAAETKAGRRTACTEAQRLHLAAQRMAAERTELEQRVRCPACLQRDRAVALVPCGHVFCASCADGVRRCLFCQEKVSQKVVLKTQFSEVIKKG